MHRRSSFTNSPWLVLAAVVAAAALGHGTPAEAARGAGIFVVGEASGELLVWDDKGKALDKGQTSYNVSDGFAVGDVDGDGADELVVAGDVSGDIDIYELGNPTAPVRTFAGGFALGNGLAVGNVMGDAREEILIAGIFSGDVDIFSGDGTLLATVWVDFTSLDGFASGNVTGDAYDEILVAGDFSGDVDIFDGSGGLITTVAAGFTVSDGFAVGDVAGDAYEEIIVAGEASGDVDIFTASGSALPSFSSSYNISDGFAVGDVDGDGRAEIVVAGDFGGDVDIYEGDGTHVRTFDGDFTIADGFAVGRFAWPDADGDGLMDDWELNGYDDNNDGIVDVDLPAMGADPNHKDLFLEFDWVVGQEPSRRELAILVDAFAQAPVSVGGVANPDGQPGINLHVDSGTGSDPRASENITLTYGSCNDGIDNDFDGSQDEWDLECAETSGGHGSCSDGIDNDGDTWIDDDDGECREGRWSCSDGADNDGDGLTDADDLDCRQGTDLGGGNAVPGPVDCIDTIFYATKAANFAAARRRIFRYAVSGDPADSTCNGGRGELGGNDFIEFNHDAGTIMHELGHTLGLHHGGDDDNNCKPNYVSVMNYDNQFGINRNDGTRIIDYSPARRSTGFRRSLPMGSLQENALSETLNVLDAGDPDSMFVFTDGLNRKIRAPLNVPADFDGNGVIQSGAEVVNLDDDGEDGRPSACDNSSSSSLLKDHDDWKVASVPFRQFGDYNDGALNPVLDQEPTLADLEAMDRALNRTDLAAALADSADPAVAGTTMDYALDLESLGPNPTNVARLVAPLPAGFSLVSAPGCTLGNDGVTLTCQSAMVFPGEVRSFTATVAIDADLVYLAGAPVDRSMTATAKNITGDDPLPANDSATETTHVVAVADLSVDGVTTTGSPAELLIGETAAVTVSETLGSAGPSSPMDATLSRTATADAGADITVLEPSVIAPAVEIGVPRLVTSSMSLGCSLPGVHGFGVTSQVEPTRPDDTDPNAANDAAWAGFDMECVVPVSIRILPSVNGKRAGVVPVEIRSNAAGEYGLPLAFDATSINATSVRFGTHDQVWNNLGGAAEDHDRTHGGADRILHFPLQDAGLSAGDSEACVKGTYTDPDGNVFKFFGCDVLSWAGR